MMKFHRHSAFGIRLANAAWLVVGSIPFCFVLRTLVVYQKSPVRDFGGGSWPWKWNWTELFFIFFLTYACLSNLHYLNWIGKVLFVWEQVQIIKEMKTTKFRRKKSLHLGQGFYILQKPKRMEKGFRLEEEGVKKCRYFSSLGKSWVWFIARLPVIEARHLRHLTEKPFDSQENTDGEKEQFVGPNIIKNFG